jgi:hypothetical protein
MQQNMSKKRTLGVPFYVIATIANVLVLDVGYHNEAWRNHQ